MVATPEDVAFIDRLLLPEAVDEVAHDGGVVAPPASRLLDLTVTPQKAMPLPRGIRKRETHRFGTGAADDKTKSGSLVGDLVKRSGRGIENVVDEHGKRMSDPPRDSISFILHPS